MLIFKDSFSNTESGGYVSGQPLTISYKLLINYTPVSPGSVVSKSFAENYMAGTGVVVNTSNLIPITGATLTFVPAYATYTDDSSTNHAVPKSTFDAQMTTLRSHAFVFPAPSTNQSKYGSLTPGDIVRFPTTVTPAGFLRVNGAVVNKADQPNLYAVIGDRYSTNNISATYDMYSALGSGKPWTQQYGFNPTITNIYSWAADNTLPDAIGTAQVVATKNRVYLIGGLDSAVSTLATVYTAPINSDGTLGTWVATTSLPGPLSNSQAVVTENRLYLLGGSNGAGAVATVYTAPINSDGTLGAWTTGVDLFEPLASSQAVVTKNRVYLVGGVLGTGPTNRCYYSDIAANGTLGQWYMSAGLLPYGVGYSQLAVTKNKVYMFGGYDHTYSYRDTILVASIASNGSLGTFVSAGNLPFPRAFGTVVVTNGRIYLTGGLSAAGVFRTDVWTAVVAGDGTLGAWGSTSDTGYPVFHSQALVTKNTIRLLGGMGPSGAATNAVSKVTLSSNLNDYSFAYNGVYNKFDGTGISNGTPISLGNVVTPEITAAEADVAAKQAAITSLNSTYATDQANAITARDNLYALYPGLSNDFHALAVTYGTSTYATGSGMFANDAYTYNPTTHRLSDWAGMAAVGDYVNFRIVARGAVSYSGGVWTNSLGQTTTSANGFPGSLVYELSRGNTLMINAENLIVTLGNTYTSNLAVLNSQLVTAQNALAAALASASSVSSTQFVLPDRTARDAATTPGLYSYIKT